MKPYFVLIVLASSYGGWILANAQDFCGPSSIYLNATSQRVLKYPSTTHLGSTSLVMPTAPAYSNCTWFIHAQPGQYLQVDFARFEPCVVQPDVMLAIGMLLEDGSPGGVLKTYQKLWEASLVLNASEAWIQLWAGAETRLELRITGKDPVLCEGDDAFLCESDLSCINSSQKCDGFPNCLDKSDEFGCGGCSEEKMDCDNYGVCVDAAKLCDGINSCINYYDELHCGYCGPSFVHLDHTQPVRLTSPLIVPESETLSCIWIVQVSPGSRILFQRLRLSLSSATTVAIGSGRNPGIPGSLIASRSSGLLPVRVVSSQDAAWVTFYFNKHTYNGGDNYFEFDLKQYNTTVVCSWREFGCSDGLQCIPSENRCNLVLDCDDRSDELGCYNCLASKYSCRDGTCVDYDKICDDIVDCDTLLDEYDCYAFCGSGFLYATASEHTPIHFSAPPYHKYFCGWIVTITDDPSNLIYVDIVSMDDRQLNHLYMSTVADVKSEETLWLGSSANLPGSTWIAAGGVAYLGAGSYRKSALPTEFDLNIRIETESGLCGVNQTLFAGFSVCLSNLAVCDGKFVFENYVDELNCEICGNQSIQLPTDHTVYLDVQFDKNLDKSTYAVYQSGPISVTTIEPTQPIISHDSMGQYDCLWHITAPPGTRIEFTLTAFSDEGNDAVLKIYDGGHAPDTSTLLKVLSVVPVEPETVYFPGSRLLVVLVHEFPFRPVRNMVVMFTAHEVQECSADQYQCSSNKDCLDKTRRCNGIIDCPLYSDELNCGSCSAAQFECVPGVCIKESEVCDKIADCGATNDEFNCSHCRDSHVNLTAEVDNTYTIDYPGKTTGDCAWTVESPTGTRIRATLLHPTGCRLAFGDGPYTRYSNTTAAFRVVGTPKLRWKDSAVSHPDIAYPSTVTSRGPYMWMLSLHCHDSLANVGFGVKFTSVVEKDCSDGLKLCNSGTKCVEESAFCDAKVDCPEYEDEIGCGDCNDDEFSCLTGDMCVPTNALCNGFIDCSDRSDEYSCEPCGASNFNLTSTDFVTISSPLWPKAYPEGVECVYLFQADASRRIMVTFEEFNTEAGYDLLVIGNGHTIKENVILMLSGISAPSKLASKQNQMYMAFSSDYLVARAGFLLHVAQVSEQVACSPGETPCDYRDLICVRESNENICPDLVCNWDITTITDSVIELKSPNYPQPYPPNLYCKWPVPFRNTQPQTVVKIVHFATESTADTLRLSGIGLQSGDETMYELTGSTKLRSVVFNGTGDVVVWFETDSNVQLQGFYLRFIHKNVSKHFAKEQPGVIFHCDDGARITATAKCDGFLDCANGDDEISCASVYCPGFYHCSKTKTCITMDEVCDGAVDCQYDDDEIDCVTKRCPENCTCKFMGEAFHVRCLEGWRPEDIKSIAKIVQALRLSGSKNDGADLLLPGMFKELKFLRSLSIPYNELRSIPHGTFYGLESLTYLNISGNDFIEFEAHMFAELSSLEALVITDVSSLRKVAKDAFYGLDNLKTFVLVPDTDNNVPLHVEDGAFSSLTELTKVVVDDYRLCCSFVSAIPGFQIDSCETTQSQPPLNLCGSLLQNYGLRICIWILGLSALVGNAVVIVWRMRRSEANSGKRVHSCMVVNLAVSDFIMGVYMIMVAAADIHYGERYFEFAPIWRDSLACKMAGVLSVLSSEASVMFVTLISLDCFLRVVLPFSTVRLSERSIRNILIAMWLSALCLAVIPTVLAHPDSDIYGLSDVCIGLPLTTKDVGVRLEPSDIHNPFGSAKDLQIVSSDSQKPAWILSIVLFLGINFACFLIVLCCYVAIFVRVRRSVHRVKRTAHRDRDIKMAVKMALIVGTDFACWMPVIVLGILSQSGAVRVNAAIYSWIVVLVLPINSSLNPYLYTILSIIWEHRRNSKESANSPPTSLKPQKGLVETLNSFLSETK